MTEQEWLESADPERMVQFICERTTDRKVRLWACACWRRARHLTHENFDFALDAAERVADGWTKDRSRVHGEVRDLKNRELQYWRDHRSDDPNADRFVSIDFLGSGVLCLVSEWTGRRGEQPDYHWTALNAPGFIAAGLHGPGLFSREVNEDGKREEVAAQAALLREVLGNPFRPVALEPGWLSATVADLSQAIYEEHAFERLPILADALMEAGCDSDEIIQHCRSDGPHARGCWVVDLLLGRS